MARSIWTGSISLGLVNIPVKLYSAVRSHDVPFHQYGPKGARIRNKRVSEKTGKEIDYADIQKGYDLPSGDVVMLSDDELDQFSPKSTKTIDIEDFVDIDEIDPVYYDHTYYVGPAETGGGPAKAYSLLLKALETQNKVAIGKVVIRTKQYLAAIRPFDGAIVLNTMRFADEIVPTSDIDLPDGKSTASDKEVKMATQIIDSLTAEWDPSRYHDTYTEQLMDYIQRKAEGKDVVVPEQEEEPEKVVDLMAALQASLDAAKGKKPAAKKKAPAKKAPGKKAPARKKTATQRKSA